MNTAGTATINDALSEHAARLYDLYLRRRFPDITWLVRVVREHERPLNVVPSPLPGDIDGGIGGPDDVDAPG
jgi:hypothetical protein